MKIDHLITIVLGIFVFTALIGGVADQINFVGGTNNGTDAFPTNVTGAPLAIIGLTVLVLVIGFIASIVKTSKLGSGKGGRN